MLILFFYYHPCPFRPKFLSLFCLSIQNLRESFFSISHYQIPFLITAFYFRNPEHCNRCPVEKRCRPIYSEPYYRNHQQHQNLFSSSDFGWDYWLVLFFLSFSFSCWYKAQYSQYNTQSYMRISDTCITAKSIQVLIRAVPTGGAGMDGLGSSVFLLTCFLIKERLKLLVNSKQ